MPLLPVRGRGSGRESAACHRRARRARRSACGRSRRGARGTRARRRRPCRCRRRLSAPSRSRVMASSPRQLDADRALRHGRQHLLRRHGRGDAAARPRRSRPAQRQQGRIGRAVRELAQARLDIAAAVGPRAGRAAAARPAPAAAATRCRPPRRRQLGEAGRLGADEGVAHVLARQKRRSQARRQHGRHVLHRVDGEIDLAASSASSISLVNRPLPPTSRERPVLDAVAGGA